MRGRMENGTVRTRVSRALMSMSAAAVAGCRKASATSNWGGGMGGGETWVRMLFRHEGFETSTPVSDRNDGARRGIWPRNGQSPSGPVSGHLSFRLRVAITVEFSHREWGLRICAWADDGVPRCGAYALRVSTAEAVLKEDLEGS